MTEEEPKRALKILVVHFPVSLNPEEDIVFEPADIHDVSVSWGRLTEIAAALEDARKKLLEAPTGHPALLHRPETVLAVSSELLRQHEKRITRGQSLSISMAKKDYIEDPIIQNKLTAAIKVPLSDVNIVLKSKSGGLREIHFLDGHIVIMAIKDSYPIKIGDKVYDALFPHNKNTKHYGFSNKRLSQIAATGFEGMLWEESELKLKLKSVITLVSNTNRTFREHGFNHLDLCFVAERLYLFDYTQQTHLEKRRVLRQQTHQLPGDKYVPKSRAERWVHLQFCLATAENMQHSQPKRKKLKPHISNGDESLTC